MLQEFAPARVDLGGMGGQVFQSVEQRLLDFQNHTACGVIAH
jgi:hypothetical protein